MSVSITKEAANCAYGTSLNDTDNFINSKGKGVCEVCFIIGMAEDEEDE